VETGKTWNNGTLQKTTKLCQESAEDYLALSEENRGTNTEGYECVTKGICEE